MRTALAEDVRATYYICTVDLISEGIGAMRRPRRLGEFEQMVLFAVLDLEDEAYGAAIVRAIEKRTGERPSVGAVGTALDRLESRGLLRSQMGEPKPTRGGRRPKLYKLEEAGREALRRSYETFTRMSEGLLGRLEGGSS